MAGIQVLNSLNLNGNQLLSAALQQLTSDPVSAYTGQFWFNTMVNALRWYDGASTHTLANLDTPVSSLAAATANINAGGYNIQNLATPVLGTDAASKSYVDSTAQGLDIRDSVYCATAAALPANTATAQSLTANANGALTVDGQAVSAGQRVLVKNEGTAANNGIYVVTQPGTGSTPYILTRSADFNTSANMLTGAFTFVELGTANGATGWVVTTQGTITPGTTAITWTQFIGAATYTGSTFISVTGNVISLNRYAATFGDGVSTSYVITHNLGTRDVIVTVYQTSGSYDEVLCEVQRTSTNSVTLLFGAAPASNSLRVVVG